MEKENITKLTDEEKNNGGSAGRSHDVTAACQRMVRTEYREHTEV